jgi:fermentation-respiration switch protein FrsA (DUF1100 family)
LVVNQDNVLYVPKIQGIETVRDNPVLMQSPLERGVPFQNLMLSTRDGERIHAWYMAAPNGLEKAAPTVLFLHANAGNMGLRMDQFVHLHEDVQVNLLAIDYRGYGDSTGKPSEPGLIEDARTAYEWIMERGEQGLLDPSKVFIFGRSLGGAVAVHIADLLKSDKHGDGLRGLILENTFTSISDIIDILFPWLAWSFIKKTFVRLKWDTISKVKTLDLPMLLLAGDKDEIVPHSHMLRINAAALKPKLHIVAGGMHNDTWMRAGKEYWKWIANFIQAEQTGAKGQ